MRLFIIFILIFIICIFLFNYSNESFTNTEYILAKQIYCYWNDYSNNPIIIEHLLTWKKIFQMIGRLI
jgi:hypothetical protein